MAVDQMLKSDDMNILIINLPKSTERLAFQRAQFDRLGLNFEVLAASSIVDISEEQYRQQAFGWERPLKKVELACFLSHKRAWQKVLDDQKPYLILEDDAVLASCMSDVLLDLISLDQSVDMINLEVRSRKKILAKSPDFSISHGVQLWRLYQDRTGTGGYIMFPSGAQKVLDKCLIEYPANADAFLFSCYALKAYQAEPALLIQEDQLEPYGLVEHQSQLASTIGRSEQYKPEYKNYFTKFTFKMRRIRGQLRLAARLFAVILFATKRFVQLNKSYFDLSQDK